jgi:hypothetical protein
MSGGYLESEGTGKRSQSARLPFGFNANGNDLEAGREYAQDGLPEP